MMNFPLMKDLGLAVRKFNEDCLLGIDNVLS